MDNEAKAIFRAIRDLAKAKGLTLAELPATIACDNLGDRIDLADELGYLMITEAE
jgi:hypothetical protein